MPASKSAKIASDTKPAALTHLSKRVCYSCKQPIVANQIRVIKAHVPLEGRSVRFLTETRHYCAPCYNLATKG
jgi:hypothetical protein